MAIRKKDEYCMSDPLFFDKKKIDDLTYNKEKMKQHNDFSEWVDKDELLLINSENYTVSKDNDLVRKDVFKFSEFENKCFAYLISRFKPEEIKTENDFIELSIMDICRVFHLTKDSNNYLMVRNAFSNMNEQHKWIPLTEEGKGEEEDFRMFKTLRANPGEMYIKIQVHQKLLDKIQGLTGNFTHYLLVDYCSLKSKYSQNFFEYCMSYRNIDPFYIVVEDIRRLWDIPKEKTSAEIKRDIIEKAIKEIYEKIGVKYIVSRVIKDGKKIKTFEIKREGNKNIEEIYAEKTRSRKEYLQGEENRKEKERKRKKEQRKIKKERDRLYREIDEEMKESEKEKKP